MQFTDIYHNLILFGQSGGGWLIKASVILLVAGIGDWLMRMMLNRLQQKLESTPNPWDEAAIIALRGPASLLLWAIVVSWIGQIIPITTGNIHELGRDIGIIYAICWAAIRLIRCFQQHISRQINTKPDIKIGKLEAATAEIIGKLLRVSVLIIGALMGLQTIGVSIAGALAFGGVGGIAVGFAARDLLANLFGGLMLHLDRPFSVGDWVKSPDREIEGTVEHIGWRVTRIRAFDMSPIYMPNGVLANLAIVNPSRMTHRRIYEIIGIRYRDADKMQDIVAEISTMLKSHNDIDQGQTVVVNFNKFAQSSLDFFVYAYTRTTAWVKYHEIKQDILLKIIAIIINHKAKIAFPTTVVEMADEIHVNNTNYINE